MRTPSAPLNPSDPAFPPSARAIASGRIALRFILPLVLFSIGETLYAYSTTLTASGSTTRAWLENPQWNPQPAPNSTGHIANIGPSSGGASTNLMLTGPVIVGALNFTGGSASTQYVLHSASALSRPLIFQNTGTTAASLVLSGNNKYFGPAVRVILRSDLNVTNSISSNRALVFQGGIDLSGRTMRITGGKTQFSGSNQSILGASLILQGGAQLSPPTATPSNAPTFVLRKPETIIVTGSSKFVADGGFTFDLTRVEQSSFTLIDYGGNPSQFQYTGTNLQALLTASSVSAGWTLVNTGSSIQASNTHAQAAPLLFENFQTTPVGSVPPNFTVTGTKPPTNIRVVDSGQSPFGALLRPGEKALLIEDLEGTSQPRVRVSWPTPASPLQTGWMRLKYIPLHNVGAYVTPRFFFHILGTFGTTAVMLQSRHDELYYYDPASVPRQFDQSVTLNEGNELVTWFDTDSTSATAHTISAELNGQRLTVSGTSGGFAIDTAIPTVQDLELRAGDAVATQEGLLLLEVEVGRGQSHHSGTSGYIDVTVPPRPLASGQTTDESPASVVLNFPQLLRQAGFNGHLKLSSLKVFPVSSSTTALPCRWYDDDAPQDFPACVGALSGNNNNLVPKAGSFFGAIYAVAGHSGVGRLAWLHRQVGSASSDYRIYFETQPTLSQDGLGPMDWVGDGSFRFIKSGVTGPMTTSSLTHLRVAHTDWDADGLQDMILGDAYGVLFVRRNSGTAPGGVPKFLPLEYIRGTDGHPVTIGEAAAPLVVDWNNDGADDLLVGTHWNRIAYFRNTGTNNEHRRFAYEGVLKVNGTTTLELPYQPDHSTTNYERDYYPVLEAVDWDGDGDKDLLAGGYVTGRIFYYENVAQPAPGAGQPKPPPTLEARGPISAGGSTLDVGDWCAAPAVGFSGTGTNTRPAYLFTGLLSANAQPTPFLRYYVNTGTGSGIPQLVEQALPITGTFPSTRMASPRLVDLTGDNGAPDGKPDLLVASANEVYLFKNTGTSAGHLRWEATNQPLDAGWKNAGITASQLIPIDSGTLAPDVFGTNMVVYARKNAPNPYAYENGIAISSPAISHPSTAFSVTVSTSGTTQVCSHAGGSSANTRKKLFDLDGDGRLDLLIGDYHGQIWYHRNTGTSSGQLPFTFNATGTLCIEKNSGATIDTDLTLGSSFDISNAGARTVFTVNDFNNDGKKDLVVADTYGNVRYFRGAYTGANAYKFEDPIWLEQYYPQGNPPASPPTSPRPADATRGTRVVEVEDLDWNRDGKMDVLVSSDKVRLYINNGAGFDAPWTPTLPIGIDQPKPMMTDMNNDGGGDDMFVGTPSGSIWIERSFLDNGYAVGHITGVQPNP